MISICLSMKFVYVHYVRENIIILNYNFNFIPFLYDMKLTNLKTIIVYIMYVVVVRVLLCLVRNRTR